jgi:hypothetical protein
MTVSEMIDFLADYPGDAHVLMALDYLSDRIYEIADADESDHGNVVISPQFYGAPYGVDEEEL